MLAVLAGRERNEVGRKLAAERGTSFRTMRDGERVSGTYKESLQLVSGKYALVENAREFTLVPWRPVIDKDLGRAVTGVVRGDDFSWQFGRARGLCLGMYRLRRRWLAFGACRQFGRPRRSVNPARACAPRIGLRGLTDRLQAAGAGSACTEAEICAMSAPCMRGASHWRTATPQQSL